VISSEATVLLHNIGPVADHVTGLKFRGADPDDFVVESNTCQSVAPIGYCQLKVAFVPGAIGTRTATLEVEDGSPTYPSVLLSGTGAEGYYAATSTGAVHGFGEAQLYGDASSEQLTKPVAAIQATPDGGGYWLVASDGGIFAFGDAHFHGSTGATHLNEPIVGMASTPDGGGYWLVASDGGIFAFGDAPYNGSAGTLGETDFIGLSSASPPTSQAILDVPAQSGRVVDRLHPQRCPSQC